MQTIEPDELKQRLLSGESLEVIDIREAGEFSTWHIHGSKNVPVYDALRSQNDATLIEHSSTIEKGRPVVTVCRGGVISKRAATVLDTLGFETLSLNGGMRGWGGVWTEAAVPLRSEVGAKAIQIRRNGKGCLSYLFGTADGAAVVDPSIEPESYIEIARREGMPIRHVIETHVHADHLSRARQLCRITGAELVMPPNRRVTYDFKPLGDGEELSVGGVSVRALATPGHTGESTCYLVSDSIVLTGDTLFINAVGRPDLEKGDAGAEAGARMLYRSLHDRLIENHGALPYYPTHFNRPIGFDGKPIGAKLGQARESIDLLRTEEEQFVEGVLARLSAKPPNFDTIIGINEGKAEIGEESWLDLEAGPNSCAAG